MESFVIGLFWLGIIVTLVVGWWRIFSKAGYPPALALLMLVPIVNFIMFCIFAFGKWPKETEGQKFQVSKKLKVLFAVLIVAGLIVVVGMVAVSFTGQMKVRGKAREAKALGDMAAINVALQLYHLDTGDYPRTLDALFTQPSGVKYWNGPYMHVKELADPWGREYRYRVPGKDSRDYDLHCLGADGVESDDDIIRSR